VVARVPIERDVAERDINGKPELHLIWMRSDRGRSHVYPHIEAY
jgi:hypothetical protein